MTVKSATDAETTRSRRATNTARLILSDWYVLQTLGMTAPDMTDNSTRDKFGDLLKIWSDGGLSNISFFTLECF